MSEGTEVVQPNTSEVEARKFGWVPQEEFKGDPNQWRDADAFLQRGREINGFLRKDLDKLNNRNAELEAQLTEMKSTIEEFSKFHKETEKRAYERAIADLKAEKKEAISDGDGDRVLQIEEQIERLTEEKKTVVAPKQEQPKVDPVFLQWKEQNSWYGTNEDLTVYADGFAQTLKQRNPALQGKAFLDAVEEKVKNVFKEQFGVPNRERPSPVDSSTAVRTSKNKRSYSDLPPEAKAACDKFVKQGLLTKDEYVAQFFE
jgi:hypothetical protein